MARHDNCCLCGEPRRPTQAPVESFGNSSRVVTMSEHRPLQAGRWEISPSMLVNVSMWRNGGTAPGETHICDGCVVVGLQVAKRFVDDALERLLPPPPEPDLSRQEGSTPADGALGRRDRSVHAEPNPTPTATGRL